MNAADIALRILVMASPMLLGAVGLAVVRLRPRVDELIKAKVKNEYLRGALVRLDDAVCGAVRELQQTTVDDLKGASPDGRLTPEQRAQLKRDVLDKAKAYLGARGVAEISEILGLGMPELDNKISGAAEAAIYDLKVARAASGVGNLVPSTA
jgi:hypothetical protein